MRGYRQSFSRTLNPNYYFERGGKGGREALRGRDNDKPSTHTTDAEGVTTERSEGVSATTTNHPTTSRLAPNDRPKWYNPEWPGDTPEN